MSLNSFGNKLRSGPLGAVFFVVVVLCVGVLAFTGIGSSLNSRQAPAVHTQQPSDDVATINGIPISVAKFQNALENYKQEYEAYGPVPSIANAGQLRVQAFKMLEVPLLEAQIAQQHGITVTSDELATERAKELDPYKTQLGLPASASESDINTALQQYGKTVDDLVDVNDVRTDLLAKKYHDYLTESNQASDATVRNYYQQEHVRHIEVSNKRLPDAEARALALNLIGRIQKGADFATLVTQYSDDTSSKAKGGDDGWIDQSTPFPPEFKVAALLLKPGQVTATPVLIAQFGYFIIQSEGSRSNLPKDFQKNHQQYVQQVTTALSQLQQQNEIEAARTKANVVAVDSRLKADLALSNLQPGDPTQNTVLAGVLSDYSKALTSADDSEKAEIYASEAQVYQLLGQTDQEVSAIKLALNNVEDSQLQVQLGDIYKQKGDAADALTQYQAASDHSYDNPDIHMQLKQDYTQLKQPALVAKETSWITNYEARQKQANAQLTPSPIIKQ